MKRHPIFKRAWRKKGKEKKKNHSLEIVKCYRQAGIGNTAHAKLPACRGDTQKLIQVHCSSVTWTPPQKKYYKNEKLRMVRKSHGLVY